MAYNAFAYWYDGLNTEADYDRRARELVRILHSHGLRDGLVADLGCGTGEMTLRLADSGFDMIAIDASPDMLCVFRNKLPEGHNMRILLLQQDLAELDLYGTVRACVSTYDTLNHLPEEKLPLVFRRVATFLEPGGVFLFDVNTPYKHQAILGDNHFEIASADDPEVVCFWENRYSLEGHLVDIGIQVKRGKETLARENFQERAFPLDFWENLLAINGFSLADARDGDDFHEISQDCQRFLITAVKKQG